MNQHCGGQSGQFLFFRLPKALFTDAAFQGLDAEAKVLYAAFLDRMSLSVQNDWRDEAGRVYIYYTVADAAQLLGCSEKKAGSLTAQLERFGLISRKRQGLGRPNRIYVRPLDAPDAAEPQRQTRPADVSAPVPSEGQDESNVRSNNTENLETESSYPESKQIHQIGRTDGMERSAQVRKAFEERWELAYVLEQRPQDAALAREVLELAVDTVCSSRSSLPIGGEDRPMDQVRSVYLSLDRWHLEYVLDAVKRSRKPVRNMRAYLLTALYNAPTTIESYYDAWVRSDGAA